METLFLAFGATLIIGAATGAVLALVYPVIRPGLLTRQPRQRANVLLVWAVAPVGVGLFFTSLLFMPSLLNRLGIPAGHCHNHAERFPHICLSDPLFSGAETLPWFLIVALTVLLAGFLAAQGVHLHRVARLKAVLRFAGGEDGAGFKLIPWQRPVAFTAGFWTPRIFISSRLRQVLSAEHFQVVLTHEQAHARHRDPLRKYLGVALSLLHLAPTRQRILKDLTLATEQACDADAAAKIGDSLKVAEAILAVQRLLFHSQKGLDGVAVGFTNCDSAARIEALLAEGDYQDPSFPDWLLVVPLLVTTSWLMPGPIHFLTELVFRH